jgi:signal transduction histidine kinase
MKIRTQSVILIAGIAIMPVLVLSLVLVVIRLNFTAREASRFASLKTEMQDGRQPDDAAVIRHIIDSKPANIDIAIGTPDGKVLFSTIAEMRPGMPFAEELIRAAKSASVAGAAGPAGATSAASDVPSDRMLTFGFTPPAPPGYSVVASVPKSSILPSDVLQNYVLAGSLALAAILAFAAVMCISIVRSITGSVLSLEAATRRVAAGELDEPITVEGSSEMTSLAASLNSLREELKEDQARQSRFIMGISHDLKTPLALVKGYAEAIEEECDDGHESVLGYVDIIKAKADQLEGMIEDLIDFVRLDTGEWSAGLAEVPLAAFLRAFLRRVESDANLLARSARGSIEIGDDLRARMDERLFTRALENLVYNALRYAPEGGSVTLSAWMEGSNCLIRVSDDGPGIKAEDLPHIFEPFYRGSSSRREQGMGLGLSIVKTIIDSHGWAIVAESHDGQGAAFTIRVRTTG